MGNLCSIFHSRFKNLIKVIPSARKAQLMDYLLLGWEKSTYQLKGSTDKWFMKPYSEIVEDTQIPKSSLARYLKELTEEGFIVKRQALFSRTNEDGTFEVKKGTYIRIAPKLLGLLSFNNKSDSQAEPSSKNSNSQKNKPLNSVNEHQLIQQNVTKEQFIPESNKQNCSNFNKNEMTEDLKMRSSYISDYYTSLKNNIIFKQLNASVDKSKLKSLMHQFQSIQQFLFGEIKEEIPEQVKKLIAGTFFNLTFQHQKTFSIPKQVAAEYLYALINTEFYFPQIQCFKHRNNILAKLLRVNQWRTPKGFYKHFYLGDKFKFLNESRDKEWEKDKEQQKIGVAKSINYITEQIENRVDMFNHQDHRLIEVETQLNEINEHINNLEKLLYTDLTEEDISMVRSKIEERATQREELWDKQAHIEKELNQTMLLNNLRNCA